MVISGSNTVSAAVWPCRNKPSSWSDIEDLDNTTAMQDIDEPEEILLDGLIASMRKIDCNVNNADNDAEINNKNDNDNANGNDINNKNKEINNEDRKNENIQKFFDDNPHVAEAVFSTLSEDENNHNNTIAPPTLLSSDINKNIYPAEISIRDVLLKEFKSGKQYTVFNLLKIVQNYNDHAHYKAVHKELFLLRDDNYIKAIFTKPVRWVML